MKHYSLITKHHKATSSLLVFLFFGIFITFAQTRNPTPSSYNPYGTYTNGLLEYLRMGTGYRNEILRDTPMYDGRGLQIATARAGLLGDVNGSTLGGYNAAAMIDIKINGTPEKAVLCWNVITTNPYGRRTGFVLTKDLKYRSTIESRMATCKTNLANARPNDYNKTTTYYLIKNKTSPWPENTYVYPNQTGAANKVKYYYVNNGVVNLLVDLPYTLNVGGEIKGKAIDLASPGRSFRRISSVSSATRDVYEQGTRNVIGEVRFVYGFVYTDTNERVYCWVNYDCLELPSSKKVQTKDNVNTAINDKFYPNPTNNGEVFIKTNNTQVQLIEMYDVLGRKQDVQYYNTAIGIKIQSNYKGIGFIHYLDSDNQKIVQKIIWR
tara:strand:- start:3513 stop:4652 length:1140 start_codon:yes stop_codon:yes gene_type:complete